MASIVFVLSMIGCKVDDRATARAFEALEDRTGSPRSAHGA
jgi:hypothetical protein